MGAIDSLPAVLQQIFAHISSVLDFQVLALGKNGYSLSVGALLGAIAVILLARMFSRLVQQVIDRYAVSNEHSNRASLYTVSRVTHYSILTLGVLIALGFAGIPVSKLTLIAGGLGVGLGFGLQAIFNNFVSGLILLFDRTLKVGDFVELASGVHGTVQDIKIRATRINTNDDVDILVPNSEFVSGRLVNWTLQEATRRLRIPFGVAYGSPKEQVKAAALDAAAAVPFTQALKGQHAPQVWLTGFGDSSLNFELVVWVNAEATRRPSRAKAAYNWALETAIRAHGIEFPWPQRDVRLRSWFGLEGEEARQAIAELLGAHVSGASTDTEHAAIDSPETSAPWDGNDAAHDLQTPVPPRHTP